MSKFSLSKAVAAGAEKKRALADNAPSTPQRAKALKASDVAVEETGPSPQKVNITKLSANSPVTVVIRKYTDRAGDAWEAYRFDEADEPLYQVAIKHDVPRPITYQFREKLASFLQATKDVPDTIAELQDAGIRLIVGDRNDPDCLCA